MNSRSWLSTRGSYSVTPIVFRISATIRASLGMSRFFMSSSGDPLESAIAAASPCCDDWQEKGGAKGVR